MWEQIRANKRRSILLIFGLALLLVALGYVIGAAVIKGQGLIGAAAAVGLWLILLLGAVMGGRDILLMSAHAREIQHDDHPQLFNVVSEMSIAAGLPKRPKVYIMDSDAPNAFAVGTPENAAVAVTVGLLVQLNRDELQGVIAHEIGHIHNQDTKFMTIAGVMVAAIVIIADGFLRAMFYTGGRRRRSSGGKGGGQAQAILMLLALVLAILAPIMARLLYLACSRRREYLADACAARFTRYPEGLASALQKIALGAGRIPDVNRATAPMYIVNPLKGSAAHSLFSTHPPTGERILILRAMGGKAGYAGYESAYAKVSRKHLMGKDSLAASEDVRAREASPESEEDKLGKTREAVDILHRMEGMVFLTCTCGLKIKVPPGYKGEKVSCPACRRSVAIPAAVLVAAGAIAATEAADDAGKATPERAATPKQLAYRFKPGEWQSFRCACGHGMQLSPNFRGTKLRCDHCGASIAVKRT